MSTLAHRLHLRWLALRLWLRCRRDADLARRVNSLLALYQEEPDVSLR